MTQTYTFKVGPDYTIATFARGNDLITLDEWSGSMKGTLNSNQKRQGRVVLRVEKSTCERCGFVPEDSCQMDFHHKDGDRRNNVTGNISVLCANCHRLITKRERINLPAPDAEVF
jgi:ribosomal protein L37E